MRKSNPLAALALFATLVLCAVPAGASELPYVLRDTTGFPPPAAGTARLVVMREQLTGNGLKPEFVFVDRTPIGFLPQKAGVTAEIPAGLHKVWLGRGAASRIVWIDFAEGGRYLVRMREAATNAGEWRSDFVLDSPEGYADFAVAKKLQLAIVTPTGMGSLKRNLDRMGWTAKDAKKDSLTRNMVSARLKPPIQYREAYYQDLLDPTQVPMDYEHHTGRLVLDDSALRYFRGDSVAVDIPRDSIETVRYGGFKSGRPNPWIKIGWRVNGAEKAATFAHTSRDSAAAYYNLLFQVLAKDVPPAK